MSTQFTFRMRCLPKPEYRLMRELITRYQLADPSELVAAMVQLTTEVIRYQDGQGEQWWLGVIDRLRSTTQMDRTTPHSDPTESVSDTAPSTTQPPTRFPW